MRMRYSATISATASAQRCWETRAGALELSIPRLRHASYLRGFLRPRRATEQALTAVVQEAYPQGYRRARWTRWCGRRA